MSRRWHLSERLEKLRGKIPVGEPRVHSDPVLSVIVPTYNRLPLLQRCVGSVRGTVGKVAYEIIVADSGEKDASRLWSSSQPDCTVISGGQRGATAAVNAAYGATRGRLVAILNDDVALLGDCLYACVAHLQSTPSTGQVAIPFGSGETLGFSVYPLSVGFGDTAERRIYANLGVIRRELAQRVEAITGGVWPPCYHTYGADCELSAWVWRWGHHVRPVGRAWDYRPDDAIRGQNRVAARLDPSIFGERWPTSATIDGAEPPRLDPHELERMRVCES